MPNASDRGRSRGRGRRIRRGEVCGNAGRAESMPAVPRCRRCDLTGRGPALAQARQRTKGVHAERLLQGDELARRERQRRRRAEEEAEKAEEPEFGLVVRSAGRTRRGPPLSAPIRLAERQESDAAQRGNGGGARHGGRGGGEPTHVRPPSPVVPSRRLASWCCGGGLYTDQMTPHTAQDQVRGGAARRGETARGGGGAEEEGGGGRIVRPRSAGQVQGTHGSTAGVAARACVFASQLGKGLLWVSDLSQPLSALCRGPPTSCAPARRVL